MKTLYTDNENGHRYLIFNIIQNYYITERLVIENRIIPNY